MNKTLRTILITTAAAAGFLSIASAAQAASCDPGKPGDELTYEEAQVVYDCIEADLVAGYLTGDKTGTPAELVRDYRSWTLANTLPANPGWHANRFLITRINDIGAAEYLKFAEERGPMPVGTLIAKESFAVNGDGKVKPGPLFIMQKVAAGVSPKTDDWYYLMVSPKGKPMWVNVFKACAECHQGNFGASDGLGYPIEDVRVGQ